MDFYKIKERPTKNGVIEIYPDFKVCRSKDLMIRGNGFYAVWNETANMWSTDEYHVQQLVDEELKQYYEDLAKKTDAKLVVKYMYDFSTNTWAEFKRYLKHMSDNSHQLDNKITFRNTPVTRKDYVSKRVDYDLKRGECNAWNEIMGTLYDEAERDKLEWAIGSIIAGDSKDIQKFVVLFGAPGTGKGTFINILQKLFQGYYQTFDAKALGSSNNQFAAEIFKSNPLIAIQHDGDLSKIEDNTKLNSIVSHEEMMLNEKYKSAYTSKINAFLFMGTNKAVKITDSMSGIIRRLIDVVPSGRIIAPRHYHTLFSQIDFELGAIADHCLSMYQHMGKNYYSGYKPTGMMMKTDVFYNFIESYYFTFKEQDNTTLRQAYELYKIYCDEALIQYKLSRHNFREELKNYFASFYEMKRVDGQQVRSYYEGFLADKLTSTSGEEVVVEKANSLVLDQTQSLLDLEYANCKAQYSSAYETPKLKWEKVTTVLSEVNTRELHYVVTPDKHIVIDFDLKDADGNKSLERNLEAASKWPPTYAEYSKGGSGIHLHYIYDGDVEQLSRVYDSHIEILVFNGNSSLRRRLTKCNNIKIATISSGLPLKGDKMLNFDGVKNELMLRSLIEKNIKKEIHPGTKPSIDFIYKLLDDAYTSGMKYDVTDMAQSILVFASNSSNQASYCIQRASEMKFKSEEPSLGASEYTTNELVFFDVEVYPNLFVVCWKYRGKDKMIEMINPKPADLEPLLKMMLVGFNCRRYDNHIVYAAYIGYNNEQLYKLSQKIINNEPNALFAEAYNMSYADIYEFSSKKQSLKKFEIELKIPHIELNIPWDEPVPDEKIPIVVKYCGNDVRATEATFDSRKDDFIARLIIAELSGLPVNDTTQRHAAKIIFGNDRKPQDKFVYTDLSVEFPGYKFEKGVSTYRGVVVGEGGYVKSKPGMYGNAGLFDIASQHPTTGEILDIFGEYTKNYVMLKDSRLAIKHNDIEKGVSMLAEILSRTQGMTISDAINKINNILEKYQVDTDALAYALKIVINIVYGMSSAKFPNPFKDPRNVDNLMAKRGALFMIELDHECRIRGYEVVHIKTDSIKIANYTDEIKQFVFDFGKKYGYDFEHEATYDKFCLVNDAVYIAKYGWAMKSKNIGKWVAVGTQFAHPYVHKTLFTHEPIVFEDLCETKAVVGSAIYLDMNEGLMDVTLYEKEKAIREYNATHTEKLKKNLPDFIGMSDSLLAEQIAKGHNYTFIGKVGSFCPIKEGSGGGLLVRDKNDKYHAVNGSIGYRWLEANVIQEFKKQNDIDYEYFGELVDASIKDISEYGDFEWFISDEPYDIENNGIYPF